MAKHYLLFASLNYAYSILRPLEKEILRRGDEAAWYIEDECDDLLTEGERRLKTFDEVKKFHLRLFPRRKGGGFSRLSHA